MRKNALVLVTLFLASHTLGAQPASAPPDYWLGEARGEYATGTIKEFWSDESREEITTDVSDAVRRLTIQIWYPARYLADADPAPYAEDIDLYASIIQEAVGQASGWATNSPFDAEVYAADAPFPVLVYNHGGGWPSFSGTAQTEYLASHGFVVVSIGHTGDDGLRVFPDGQEYSRLPNASIPEDELETMSPLEQYEWYAQDEYRRARYRSHVEDISFVLDELQEINENPAHPLYRMLDLERVGSFGWSLGGAAAFQAASDDPRVKAAVNLDGWTYGRAVEQTGVDKPIMLVEASDNEVPPRRARRIRDGEANPGVQEREAEIDRIIWRMLSLTSADWYRVVLDGSDHGHFADYYLYPNADPAAETIGAHRAHLIINELTLEFFSRYLRGSEQTPLLSRERSHPEVRMITRLPDSDQ